MEMKDASAKAKLTIPGLLDLEAEAHFKKNGVEEKTALPETSLPGATLSSVASQSSIQITTSDNSYVPDQVALATL